MKGILIYQPTSKSAPLADFIDGLDPRLREKLLLRLYFLTQLEKPEMKEPHFKRFSIERYYPQITPENLNQKEVSVWYRISDQIGNMTKYGSKWTSLLTFPRKSRNRQNGWAFASLINAPLTKQPDA